MSNEKDAADLKASDALGYSAIDLLRSEIGTVETFLAETPENQIIERMSWENRLLTLRERLRCERKERTP